MKENKTTREQDKLRHYQRLGDDPDFHCPRLSWKQALCCGCIHNKENWMTLCHDSRMFHMDLQLLRGFVFLQNDSHFVVVVVVVVLVLALVVAR